MCPRTDNRMFSAQRIYGFSSASDLVDKLRKSIDITKHYVKELQEKRSKLLADRQIREEQEREYKESAERDKRKIMEAKRSRQEKQKAEEHQRRRDLETEARRNVIANQREQLRLQSADNPITGEMVSVQVRLPSGDKFARTFSLDDNLEKLFDAILSHKKCPDFFTVASGFPRRPVHCAPKWYHLLLAEQLVADGLTSPVYHPASSFRDAGLKRAFAVFVNNCWTSPNTH